MRAGCDFVVGRETFRADDPGLGQIRDAAEPHQLANRHRDPHRPDDRDAEQHEGQTHTVPSSANQSGLSAATRKRKALLITETELRLIASAAIMGDKSQPVNGNSTPAASGTPSAL